MTKLHLLNQYVTERLMEAVREILDVVGDMMSEYQEETARAQRENENLRRRLREVVFVAEAPWTESEEPPANLPVRPTQEVAGTNWDSRQREQTETSPGDGKQEPLNEPITLEGPPAEQDAQTPGLKKLALEIALSVVSPSASVSAELSAVHLADSMVSGSQSTSTAEPVKTEPTDADLTSDRLSQPPHTSKEPRHDTTHASCGASSSAACETSGTEVKNAEHCRARELDKACGDGCFLTCMREKQHCCLHCGKFFSQRFNLKTHLQIHSGKRPYSCSWCSKSFTQSADLRRHQRIHTGEKPHRCTWCQKSFTQVGNLKRHLRIHTGERPYCCTLCGKSFNDGDTLKKHQRIHTGERPYCCPHCSKTFTAASSLQNHLRHHTRVGRQPL